MLTAGLIETNLQFEIQNVAFPFLLFPAVCGKAERGDPWCGNSRVWLGVHSAHCHSGQHAEQWPCSSLWKTQRGGPDYVHQWHQSGGVATGHLPGHHQGMETSRECLYLGDTPAFYLLHTELRNSLLSATNGWIAQEKKCTKLFNPHKHAKHTETAHTCRNDSSL